LVAIGGKADSGKPFVWRIYGFTAGIDVRNAVTIAKIATAKVATAHPVSRSYSTLTNVRSTNQDCGELNPLTLGFIARGLHTQAQPTDRR
jgi:hypothetical protein